MTHSYSPPSERALQPTQICLNGTPLVGDDVIKQLAVDRERERQMDEDLRRQGEFLFCSLRMFFFNGLFFLIDCIFNILTKLKHTHTHTQTTLCTQSSSP